MRAVLQHAKLQLELEDWLTGDSILRKTIGFKVLERHSAGEINAAKYFFFSSPVPSIQSNGTLIATWTT